MATNGSAPKPTSFKAVTALFSAASAPASAVDSDTIVEKMKTVLKASFLLDQVAHVPLNEGSMYVLSSPPNGPNPSLNATIRVYTSSSVVTLNLEGAAPTNAVSVHDENNVLLGEDRKTINENSMSKLKGLLSKEIGFEIERVPIVRRNNNVPLYFLSNDDRIFEYDFTETVFDQQSEYQRICIYKSPTLGNALFLDDLQNLAEADLSYTRGIMNYGNIDYKDKEILILGGGDGGLLHELTKEKPRFVTMVDIDAMVLNACRQHLRGACGDTLDNLKTDSYHVIVGDCLKFMEEAVESGRKFDVVFNDMTDIPLSSETSEVGKDLWTFVKRVLLLALNVLKQDGIYLNHATGAGCTKALRAYENVLDNLPGGQKVTYKTHSAWVPSFLEEWVFYQIQKA